MIAADERDNGRSTPPVTNQTAVTSPTRFLLGIIVVAVLLRVAVAFYLGNDVVELPGTFDQISYHKLALRVLGGYGFSFGELWWPVTPAGEPTAHWSFLYTLYLTAVYALFGPNPLVARLIQAVAIGILMPWLVYRLALLLFAEDSPAAEREPDFHSGTWIGLAAAAITAIYIYFIYYAATLMTESFYIVCILWAFFLAIRIGRGQKQSWSQWVLLGLALGLTVLLRQVFLLVIPFIFVWIWYAARPKLALFLIAIGLIVMQILPWTLRNQAVFDHFVILNTNSGYAFFWGNHPIYGTRFISILPEEMGTYASLIPADLLHLNEAELDSALLTLAIDNIKADPMRYVLLSLSRISPYLEFWPSTDSGLVSNVSRVGSFGLFLSFMLVGLVRTLLYRFPSLKSRLASPFTLVYLFLSVYGAVHVLTWTLIRYRLPLDAFLIVFAGLAVTKLAQWLHARRTAPVVATSQ